MKTLFHHHCPHKRNFRWYTIQIAYLHQLINDISEFVKQFHMSLYSSNDCVGVHILFLTKWFASWTSLIQVNRFWEVTSCCMSQFCTQMVIKTTNSRNPSNFIIDSCIDVLFFLLIRAITWGAWNLRLLSPNLGKQDIFKEAPWRQKWRQTFEECSWTYFSSPDSTKLKHFDMSMLSLGMRVWCWKYFVSVATNLHATDIWKDFNHLEF